MQVQLPSWWNWKSTYALVLFALTVLAAFYYFSTPFPVDFMAFTASVVLGVVTLLLCLIFMLGAARTPMQFLVFFGTGAFGAGMGYLVGAWLTPNGDSNPLDQVRNVVAGVLTGVVGTKLLTLWDDLVDAPPGGGPPPIMTAPYFVPIVMWLVGFTVSLSAFYTVRSGQTGDVRVTYAPQNVVLQLGPKHLGVLPETVVHFAGAANSPADVTIGWDFHIEEPCGPPVLNAKAFSKAAFEKEMTDTFETNSGKLTAPTLTTLQAWINSCPGSQNWILTATSNQDRSKFSRYNIKFCRTKQDCPATPAATTPPSAGGTVVGTAGASSAGGSPVAAPERIPETGVPAAAGKQDKKKGDNAKAQGKDK